jgi:glycine/D-amino acid oxidase-like deaminating enzyme
MSVDLATAGATVAPIGMHRRLPSRRDRRILTASDIQDLANHVLPDGKQRIADAATRRKLQAVDRSCRFSPEAVVIFQYLLARLGIATARPIKLPINDVPFWHRTPNPFANYQSTPQLPARADIVIIGAGLTGAAAAYHLRNSGRTVSLLDQGDPAGEASGRNGGNFELLPENSVGVYEGLAPGRFTYMKRRYPHVPEVVLHAVSERQASLVLGLALRNRDLLKETILNERISCDFSPKGWLHLAANEKEEQGVCDEVTLAAQHGQRIEIWSRAKIRDEFGIDSSLLGRFIPGDGTYHPFKFVCGEIKSALQSGVALYTRTHVQRVVSNGGSHQIITDRGTIVADRVIVATNAFTSRLFPELAAIAPHQSQILVTEHVPDRVRGRIVTSDTGPVFFNQPREGACDGRAPLIMGGGDDRRMKNPSSRRRSPALHAHLLALRDRFYPELAGQPPSAEWIGPMAFTPDGLPCVGFLRPGIVIAAGYNGYGGSYATAAGSAAAEMVLTDNVPEWVPEAIFSPGRLLADKPYFLTEQKGMWQVAKSLCDQLQAVNRRISDALTLDQSETFVAPVPQQQVSRPPGQSTSSASVEAGILQKFPAFLNYSLEELRRLLRLMQRWDLQKNTIIFTEGSPGGTCFVIVEGSVNVSIDARGQRQLLAVLRAGQIFGQVSIIEGIARSATCSAATDVILLEIGQAECETLLRSGSPIAIKFLSTLNEGLIRALRDADLRLLRIERKNHYEVA